MTRGDEIVSAIEAALADLRHVSHGSYQRQDISRIIDPLGSRVESFLRTAAWPGSSRRENFYDLIERGRSAGLAVDRVDQLHRLRTTYNRSKHEPTAALLLGEVIESIRDGSLAMQALIALGIGAVNAPFQRELNNHLWVGFWDHYVGGETEVSVMLPGDNWTGVGTLDTLHMRMGDWETLKRLLLAHPRFHWGKAFFEPEVWEGFAGEGDFLNAGVWNGDYRELIRLLAAFEYRANRPARNEASAEARAIIQPEARISRFGWPDGPPRTRPAFASSRAAETRMSLARHQGSRN